MRTAVFLLLAIFGAASGAEDAIPTFTIVVERFIVEGDNPLTETETNEVLADFIGEYDSLDGLLAAKDALEQAFSSRGFSFHRAILPRQKLNGGIVRLQTLVYRLGDIEITGNKHFDEANIRRSVRQLQPGIVPNTKEIAKILSSANRHPSKQLDMNLRESEKPDAVDAFIVVKDRRAWSLFSTLNNIGTDETGDTRITVGAQYNNLWNRDHRLTGTYTTSPENTRNVKQYGFTYSLPLYWIGAELTAFYLNSDVDTGQVGDFEISGAGKFAGGSFQQLLPRIGRYRHEWSFGVQDRLFENDVFFLTIPLGVSVRSRPFTLVYNGAYSRKTYGLDFNIAYARNLSGGKLNDDRIYALTRSGADSDWNVWHYGGSFNYFLPKQWLLRTKLNGQLADEPLISGEQFGLGGVHSIRGFQERIVAGDNGVSGGVEIWTPPVKAIGTARFLAFYDYGYKDLENSLPGQADHADFVSSAGIGMRWQWTNYVSASIDYGHTLDRALLFDGTETGNVKWNFSLNFRL